MYSHEHDRMWRKTRSDTGSLFGCKGVDPNRNWGYHWGGTRLHTVHTRIWIPLETGISKGFGSDLAEKPGYEIPIQNPPGICSHWTFFSYLLDKALIFKNIDPKFKYIIIIVTQTSYWIQRPVWATTSAPTCTAERRHSASPRCRTSRPSWSLSTLYPSFVSSTRHRVWTIRDRQRVMESEIKRGKERKKHAVTNRMTNRMTYKNSKRNREKARARARTKNKEE